MDGEKSGMKLCRAGAGSQPVEDTEQAIGNLIHGLAELVELLGGAATVNELLEELTSTGADAYPLLRSALQHFFPRLAAGDLPSAKLLAGRLYHYQGYLAGGASIDQAANKISNKVRWTVTGVAKIRQPVCTGKPAVDLKGFRWSLRPRAHLDVLYPTAGELVAALVRTRDESILEHLLEYEDDPQPTPERERELVRAFLRRYDHGSDE